MERFAIRFTILSATCWRPRLTHEGCAGCASLSGRFCWLCVTLESIYIYIDTYKYIYTGELGYGGLNGTRKTGPSYAKSVAYI